MRVLLDDQPCESEAGSIGEAIAEVASIAEREGRVVVEVIVDGNLWGEEQLKSAETVAGVADELHLKSVDLKDLVCQTLGDASTALTEADTLQRAAAELVQADDHPQAMGKFGEALGIWLAVHEAVMKSADALQIDLAAVNVGQGSVRNCADRFNEQLRALRDTLEGGDPVGLADALAYDLPQAVGEWREALDAMQAYVREKE